MLKINVKKDNQYALLNGLGCKIISTNRENMASSKREKDEYFEVYIPSMDTFILLKDDEIDSDE